MQIFRATRDYEVARRCEDDLMQRFNLLLIDAVYGGFSSCLRYGNPPDERHMAVYDTAQTQAPAGL